MELDTTNWSGEGAFTQTLIDGLATLERVVFVRVEDAPATRSEADYNFISNEVYVAFAVQDKTERITRFGFLPGRRVVPEKQMSLGELETALSEMDGIGPPDYSDDGMMQYLRAERVIPPYQTRGYKIVELVRLYEVGGER